MNNKSKEIKTIDKIKKFCSYLTDWEEKKDYYVNDFLPQIMIPDFTGLSTEERSLFLEIYRETNAIEWKNLISTIIYIKEHSSDSSKRISIENPTNVEISQSNFKRKFSELNRKYGFEGFVHTTSFENFIKIMQDKILFSRNEIDRKNKHFNDIALQDVIEKTANPVSKYVRFYWRTKTPTNYTNEGLKPRTALIKNYSAHSALPVIMIFEPEIFLLNDKVFFTDKNAGTQDFDIYRNVLDLDFKNIFNNKPKENFDLSEWNKIKKAMCSEILFPTQISTRYIQKVIFRTECDKERAQFILGNNKNFTVDKNQFCNEWLYVDTYTYNQEKRKLEIFYHKGKKFNERYNLKSFSHKIQKVDSNNNLLEEKDCTSLVEKDVESLKIQLSKNNEAKFLIYYIDDIECLRVKLND